MTEEEIQAAVEELHDMLAAKGLRGPHVEAQIAAHRQAYIYWRWTVGPNNSDWVSHFDAGDTIAEAIATARANIEALPSEAQIKRDNATRLIAVALEAARNAEIDEQAGTSFVAQLEAMVKRLSENAITDQSEEVA